MKVLITFFIFVATAYASKPFDQLKNLIPSFATGYVINGEDASPHSAPYIVSLSSNASRHSHICGGTLISKEWVLTAAHCISKPVGMGVIAGLHKRTDVNERTQSRVVDFGLKHKGFSGGVGPYDIALLHVSEPFEFNKWVQAAALPHREQIHNGTTHLYGWGQTKALVLTAAKTLQTVQTDIVEWEQCKEILPETSPLVESNICTTSHQKGISACNGDSGGPLVKEYEGAPSEVIGIVSWGYIPCGYANLPSIYTRISSYVDWITNIMGAYYMLH